MSKSVELDKIIAAVTHDVGYPGEGPTTLGDWAEEFARRVQSIQQEADAKPKILAVYEAVSAIHFSDSSDYLPALWAVVRNLSPDLVEQLEENPAAAWHRASDAKDSAMATPTDSEAKTSA